MVNVKKAKEILAELEATKNESLAKRVVRLEKIIKAILIAK